MKRLTSSGLFLIRSSVVTMALPSKPFRCCEYLNVLTCRPPAAFTSVGTPTVNWPIASARPVASSDGSVCGVPGTMLTFDASMPARLA